MSLLFALMLQVLSYLNFFAPEDFDSALEALGHEVRALSQLHFQVVICSISGIFCVIYNPLYAWFWPNLT